MDPNKRPDDMVRITTPELAQAFIEEQIAAIREQIGSKKVLLALSGGLLLLAWWLHERFRRERQPGMTPLTFSGGPQ